MLFQACPASALSNQLPSHDTHHPTCARPPRHLSAVRPVVPTKPVAHPSKEVPCRAGIGRVTAPLGCGSRRPVWPKGSFRRVRPLSNPLGFNGLMKLSHWCGASKPATSAARAVRWRPTMGLPPKTPALKTAIKAERAAFDLRRSLQRLDVKDFETIKQREPLSPEVRRGGKVVATESLLRHENRQKLFSTPRKNVILM